MKKYYPRIADEILKDKLSYCGAVQIKGPKWCGKSTTAERQAKSVVFMQDNENKKKNILMAKNAPDMFLEGETPRLIDEWQEIPFIWDQIRYQVDHRDGFGHFILTGSATPLEDDAYSHSGIGRIVPMVMRTMSLYESKDSSGEVSLASLFQDCKSIFYTDDKKLEDYAYYVCRGGWPQGVHLDKQKALRLPYVFYEGLINEDINKVFRNTKNPERLKRMLRSYARAVATETTLDAITKDITMNEGISISSKTVSAYVNALTRLYVIEELRAWNPNLRSKTAIRTSNTRHFVDPSIACAALGLGPLDLIHDMHTFGLLFESMCVRDLRIYAEKIDGEVYHYRDKNGLEADAVIHLRNGSWAAIEVKLRSEDAIDEGAAHLIELKNKIDTTKMKEPSFLMVLTAGNVAYQREDGVFVVPVGMLKD